MFLQTHACWERRILESAVVLFALALWTSTVCSQKKVPHLAPKEQQADRILVEKSQRKLTLFRGGKELKHYFVALGGAPVGAKQRQGDQKTPEGKYVIDFRNPASQFHLSLHVSYPNAADRARARQAGVDPGGAIMIHGIGKEFGYLGALHRRHDWTLGCIAVTNEEVEEIWSLVPDGTPIEIRP